MKKVVQRGILHAVASVDVRDPAVRQMVMLLQENIVAVAKQLAAVQTAVLELQRKIAQLGKEGQ